MIQRLIDKAVPTDVRAERITMWLGVLMASGTAAAGAGIVWALANANDITLLGPLFPAAYFVASIGWVFATLRTTSTSAAVASVFTAVPSVTRLVDLAEAWTSDPASITAPGTLLLAMALWFMLSVLSVGVAVLLVERAAMQEMSGERR